MSPSKGCLTVSMTFLIKTTCQCITLQPVAEWGLHRRRWQLKEQCVYILYSKWERMIIPAPWSCHHTHDKVLLLEKVPLKSMTILTWKKIPLCQTSPDQGCAYRIVGVWHTYAKHMCFYQWCHTSVEVFPPFQELPKKEGCHKGTVNCCTSVD